MKPAAQFRDQIIQQTIETFLADERRLHSKDHKKNAKRVLPLDYGGFSSRRIAQFLSQDEESEFPLETKVYVDINYQSKVETIEDSGKNLQSYYMWNEDLIEFDDNYQHILNDK